VPIFRAPSCPTVRLSTMSLSKVPSDMTTGRMRETTTSKMLEKGMTIARMIADQPLEARVKAMCPLINEVIDEFEDGYDSMGVEAFQDRLLEILVAAKLCDVAQML
jgi:hypothetical protein